jgi:type II secretory pathway pseudopilin PulG
VVTLGIFAILVSSATGAFLSALNAERRTLATQQVLDNTRYTIELMTRAIRQADPNSLRTISPAGCAAKGCLQFQHPQKLVVQYKFCQPTATPATTPDCPQPNVLFETTNVCEKDPTRYCAAPCGSDGACQPQTVPVSALHTVVKNASFDVLPSDPADQNDQQQPRVTATITLEGNPNLYPTVDVQTTVSLRRLQE